MNEIPDKAREVHLAAHPDGRPSLDHFQIVEVEVPRPGPGEVVVKLDYLFVAAVFADLMKPGCLVPLPPYQVGDRIGNNDVGTVVASNSPDLAVGDLVVSTGGWAEYSVGPAQRYYKMDRTWFPSPVYFLSQGVTAYHGMADIAEVGEGDVVFVSGAAGGVGTLAGQIAKCRGAAKVIGSAGSRSKVDWLVSELGFDAAFDYNDGPVLDRLRELAPDGISVFFDNVGGEQFEAAVQVARPGARLALCGALSGQIGGTGGHPRLDLMRAITQQLKLRPFSCYHTPEQIWNWYQHFGQWLGEGRFVFPHTVVEGGIEQAPGALVGLLNGDYRGNVSVRL